MSSFIFSSRNQDFGFRFNNGKPRWIYDVFLSLRGEDARSPFIILLYTYLTYAGFYVFREDDDLPRENHISPSRLRAMRSSRISLVVLSASYGSSGSCLLELEKIMECRRTTGQVVVPVFYGVDPSEVLHQRGAFGEAFRGLTQRNSVQEDEKLRWRAALSEACSVEGIVVTNFGNESEDIKKVVEHVTRLLDKTHWLVVNHLVGVESRVQDVIKLLNSKKSKDVLLLGIWGMGGIGKTTVAKFIYNQIGHNFERRSFLLNIREVWEQDASHVYLQERLLFDIYKADIKIRSTEKGKMILKEVLSDKRVLLVLDDVNEMEQLDALYGSDECFGPGSRIIITTRDRCILSKLGVDNVYRVNEMDYYESIQLFSWHAFKQASPREDFAGLSRNIVAYSGGLPLALEVLGSKLFGRGIIEWQSILDELKSFPIPEVLKQLKISFNALSETEKEIFLYIACFFFGMDRNDVIKALNGFGYYATVGVRVLEEQSLITVDRKNKLEMHVLLREMGREIICERSQMEHRERINDVFLSFKPEGICASFASQLSASFENAGIHVHRNDDVSPMGHRISVTQLQAMRESRVFVILLSRDYANSRWCLQELENIMLCCKTIGQVVVPLFHGVDPLEVRHQRGKFGEAFNNMIRRLWVDKDQLQSWRTALHEASSISWFVIINSRNESEDIMNVVGHVACVLATFVVEHPVGVQSRLQEVSQLMKSYKSKDVLLLGIWGAGGIGKTTIARATYIQIGHNFEGRSFLRNIRETWEQNKTRVSLQEQLLSDICKTTDVKIQSIDSGKFILRERLCKKKVLLVLDDVNKLEQLNVLCGSREWFGPGSLIIITTRDKHLVNEYGVDLVYRITELDSNESVELFSWHAFKQPCPRGDFVGLSSNVVAYAGGLPLAIEVLGSVLFGKGSSESESILDKFKGFLHPSIKKVLMKSFDDLNDDTERETFLDISCFFIGMDRKYVIQTFNVAENLISVLEERSLVIVDEMNKLGMHVLLQAMGREIFLARSRMKPVPRIYDAFLSFRGDHTHASFTSCLYTSLENAGISIFRGDDILPCGDPISISLLKAIRGSSVFVILLSKNCADSSWCLEELEKIFESCRNTGQLVLLVFNNVHPYEVSSEKGMFGEAFEDLIKKISVERDMVRHWRIELQKVCGISGFIIVDFRNENEVIKNVVEHVSHMLDCTNLFVADHPVGVESRVQDVVKLLNNRNSKDVLILGIWGMGGIGKTTIAKAIYNRVGRNFERGSFIQNIREVWEQNPRLVSLQEQLLFDIYKTTEVHIPNIESGKRKIMEILCHKSVILVLDDVHRLEQLNALCGSREWFGRGSVIIITTRHKHLLSVLGVDHVYKMKELDYSESVELFSWHAFKQESPIEDFAILSRKAVGYSGGLPLALEVLGSDLFGRGIKEWESALDKLERIPHTVVNKVLKISFDGLIDDIEREIFLDVACFFVGKDKNYVIQTLNGFASFVETRISVLEDQSLVTVDEKNKLRMHVLMQAMGREIIRKRSRMEPGPRIYDVFLSFRGEDTRASFTSHLYTSLQNVGVYVFKDDVVLERGDRISFSLLQAIRRSTISVIVLSRNYANSRWCLQELENIMECHRTMGQVVLPVFYGVDPSEVRHQTGMFGEAFEDLIRRILVEKDKVLSWRTALQEVGGIAGFVIIDSRNESDDVKNVVEHVTRLLDKTDLFVAEHPVGIESRVQHLIQLLNNQQSKDVLLLGIWGMGGIGKTTISKATYNQIGCNFEGRSFLLNIREVWEQDNGQVSLQEQLLSDIYKTEKIKIPSIESGKMILKDRLGQKRVLIVLDDVNKLEQLNALCGSRKWFGQGSRIVITTRDEHLLRVLKVDVVCRMKEMDESESIELLSLHAFKQASPKEEFAKLSRNVVAYCSGLPLALEVLGSCLFERGIMEWSSILGKLKRIPNDLVQKKLKISYDDLNDDTLKEIFLDIACFFIGMDRNDVIQILNGCGFYAEIGITVLVERSLVTVDNRNKLGMHDLLRDMGRQIVRGKLPKEPEKHSRLWHQEEVIDVLSKHTGTESVEGLALKLPTISTSSFRTKAFDKMKKLRLLQLAGVQLLGNFECLSRDLRWLCWDGFPLRHTPTNCYQRNLVAIEFEYSNLKIVWKEAQVLEKLRILNLSHSPYLRETPDFTNLPNLEKLILKDCPSLSSISHTIGHLSELLLINLKDCTSLRKLPRSIYKLKSLKTLILSGCLKIDKLEEDLEQMESLTTLIADETAMTRVPFSIVRSKSIGYISLCGYEGFSRDVFPSLIWSWMSPTKSIASLVQTLVAGSSLVSLDVPNTRLHGLSCILKDLQKIQRLWVECGSELQLNQDVARILDTLNATNVDELEAMPTTSQVSNIKTSNSISCCTQVYISGSTNSLNSLLIQMGMKCQVTNTIRENIFQKSPNSGPVPELLLGDSYPDWLTFNDDGNSVIFEVPEVNGRKLKTMICIFYYSYSSQYNIPSEFLKNVLIINYTKYIIQVYKPDGLSEDEDWQRILSTMEPGNKVKVVAVLGSRFNVKKTVVYLIYDELIDKKMEHCHTPDKNVIVSGGDQNIFCRPFNLPSFVYALLISRPFWFSLAAIQLVCSHRRAAKRRD